MVTIIDGMKAVRSVCLYSSGISYAIVKAVFHQNLCGGHRFPELCKSFLALPESGSSLLLLLCFRESFARLISASSVRPATLSHLNIATQAYIPDWYTYKREPPYRPQCFPLLAKAFASLVFPGFGCPELLRPRTRCYN